jgi:NADH dehydrogenase [ubiquinone] 1 alpha subcomplex assembly factor 7
MTPVERALRQLIALEGPQSLERVMGMANAHYYATRDPFGPAGDFMTSPEISQMFGEMLGVWVLSVWEAMGCSSQVRLVELGPGRGTLMKDVLRAAKVLPGFLKSVSVHLVETSPVLRRAQEQNLTNGAAHVSWHDHADEVPAGPVIVLANEFFDALPVKHYLKGDDGWHERVIALENNAFVFGLARGCVPDSLIPARFHGAETGQWVEFSPQGTRIMDDIAQRIARYGGAALIIDYGHEHSRCGETLQAVRQHQHSPVLERLGEGDLSAHVDFQALGEAAQKAGTDRFALLTQAALLNTLGLPARYAALAKAATTAQKPALDSAVERLTDTTHPTAMGQLFKALCVTQPNLFKGGLS